MVYKQLLLKHATYGQRFFLLALAVLVLVFIAVKYSDQYFFRPAVGSMEETISSADDASDKQTEISDRITETYLTAKPEEVETVLVSGDKSSNTQLAVETQSFEPCPTVDYTAYAAATTARAPITVLMYHHIAPIPPGSTLPGLYHQPEVFEDQLRTMKLACFSGVFASEVGRYLQGDYQLPAKPVVVTFDDGYEDMYTSAYPLLKKYGMKGTMYIIVEALGLPGYLTKEQVKEMADSGYVEIASHTLNHVNLKQSSDAKSLREIVDSKKQLEEITGKPVTGFAYPFGFFRYREEDYCRQAGYLTCASTYQGSVQSFDRRYSLYRLRPGYRTGSDLLKFIDANLPGAEH